MKLSLPLLGVCRGNDAVVVLNRIPSTEQESYKGNYYDETWLLEEEEEEGKWYWTKV